MSIAPINISATRVNQRQPAEQGVKRYFLVTLNFPFVCFERLYHLALRIDGLIKNAIGYLSGLKPDFGNKGPLTNYIMGYLAERGGLAGIDAEEFLINPFKRPFIHLSTFNRLPSFKSNPYAIPHWVKEV